MTKLARLLGWSLIGASVCNLVLAADIFYRRSELRRNESGATIPMISGVRLNGESWRASLASCRVIRITKDDCPYCRLDKSAYAEFVQAAKQADCEILELAPRAGDMSEDVREGIVQLKYIDTDLGPSVFPIGTPMTIVVDATWKVKWKRLGAFSSSSLKDGIRVLQRFPSGSDVDDPLRQKLSKQK